MRKCLADGLCAARISGKFRDTTISGDLAFRDLVYDLEAAFQKLETFFIRTAYPGDCDH